MKKVELFTKYIITSTVDVDGDDAEIYVALKSSVIGVTTR